MNLRSVGRFPLGLLWILLLCFCYGYGQTAEGTHLLAATANGTPTDSSVPSALKRVAAAPVELFYAGSYSPDGKYQTASKMTRWYNREALPLSSSSARPPEVPPFVDLHSRERVVENLKPGLHATRTAKGQSFWAGLRDSIITFAYGREQVLLGPHHVVVDSQGRVLLTDPAARAVHVLDGDKSFRISAGPNRRLFSTGGIAVDGDDNIYVADNEQGVVAVFDRDGTFVRYIGRLGREETLFHHPMGIAIDRRAGKLYVLDSERHLMFILDLQGKELKRVGRYNGNDTIVDFDFPTEIAVGQKQLAIMDAAGSRIWITDLDGTPKASFRFPTSIRRGMVDELGLALDVYDHIYISNAVHGDIAVYDWQGHALTTISHADQMPGQMQRPTGLWIDASNRLFVADEGVRRVELFQVREVKPPRD